MYILSISLCILNEMIYSEHEEMKYYIANSERQQEFIWPQRIVSPWCGGRHKSLGCIQLYDKGHITNLEMISQLMMGFDFRELILSLERVSWRQMLKIQLQKLGIQLIWRTFHSVSIVAPPPPVTEISVTKAIKCKHVSASL